MRQRAGRLLDLLGVRFWRAGAGEERVRRARGTRRRNLENIVGQLVNMGFRGRDERNLMRWDGQQRSLRLLMCPFTSMVHCVREEESWDGCPADQVACRSAELHPLLIPSKMVSV
jgi:hypothetical protein